MPVTCQERYDSREVGSGDSPAATFKYVVRGTSSEQDALAAVEAAAPLAYDGLVRTAVEVTPLGDGSDLWEGSARYGLMSSKPKEVGESTYQFDTGGGTQHITQAKEHVSSYAPPDETPPDHQGAIGVTHDSVEGCDITVPVYNFSETHYFDAAAVTPSYKATLFSLTGKTNSASFKGFAAGEVLFLGASGSQRGDGAWEITFRFAASPNAANLAVGSITVASKKGWEHMSVGYADAEDDQAKCIVKRPKWVDINRVYDAGNFAGLGIGT